MNQNQPLLLACWDTNSCCSCWDTNSWGIPLPRFWRNPFFVTGLSARSWIAAISPAHCLGAVLNGTDRRDRPCLFIEPPFSEIHGMVAKLAPNRIPWCLDVWRMFESFSMKQSPKHHFWRLGLQYQNILKSLSKKDGYDYWISTHTLSLSLYLSLSIHCMCLFLCLPHDLLSTATFQYLTGLL